MVKLFRKNRQKLIADLPPSASESSKKIGKYLLYTVGEIFLVVVGILIALQINNRNNYQEQRKVEQEYLSSLQSEFEVNLNKADTAIIETEEQVKALQNLITLFDKDILDTVDLKSMSMMFRPVISGQLSYEPATGVLNDIISSGKLNLILNPSLRQRLASFQSKLDFIKVQENVALNIKDNLLSLLYKKGSIRIIAKTVGIPFEHQSISEKVDNKIIFSSVEFENYLIDYFLTMRSSNGPQFLGGLKQEIASILEEIEQELDK